MNRINSHERSDFITRRGMKSDFHIKACFVLLIITMSTAWAQEDQQQRYTCPMHPHYIATDMGTCPICGMDLVPLSGEAATDAMINDQGETGEQNRQAITIAPETIQNIGVRTEKAALARFGKNVRSYGLVTENARLTRAISGRVAGWIETLNITAIGDEVKKGDLLFTLYSPDLVSAQQDYLAALTIGNEGRIRSSARRLQSLGASQKTIAQLRSSRKKSEHLPFYAESNGVVSNLMVHQGSYVKPGMQIANIQNYQSVWINVSVAEKDLQFIDKDSQATVTFPNLGNVERSARIDYLYPTIDENSRTGRIRLVLDNADGVLKPGAYADIVFETNIDKRLSVPSEAILKSSEGDRVVIALGEGKFRPQVVQTGIRSQGRTEIIQGLTEDDRVVISSQFLIDSESTLRESFNKMQRAQAPLSSLDVSSSQLAMINHLVDAALYLHEAETAGLEPDANMLAPAQQLNQHLMPVFKDTQLKFVLEDAEKALQAVNEAITDQARKKALADLVLAIKPWITEGKPETYKELGVQLFLDHETGYYWLQFDDDMTNPYGQGHAVEVELNAVAKTEKAVPETEKTEGEDSSMTAPMGGQHVH